ncbi:MAG TPA: RNA polymerase sporulation sigma factor SigG [Ruminococcaceae bacterium]|nr:RNA polymerase sporulation sigma factor SigG [Oscillospiraceae bacterium]
MEYQNRFQTIILVQKVVGGGFLYYNKVEISGVNTAKLTVLKESEKTELLKRVKQGDMTAREELIRGNLRLVLSVIQRFTNRGESADDLFQVGCIGLIKAIDNFDITQNVRFSTYAVPMIMGELRRYLRDNAPVRVSRSMRDTAYKAMQAKEKLITEKGREPKIEEIAKELGVPRQDVVIALEAISEPISLYEPVFSESGDTIYVLDQLGDHNDDMNWLNEISLKEAIEHLGKREKRILNLRFFRGKTQVEVAKEIGISQAQVSRLEKCALNKIKNRI